MNWKNKIYVLSSLLLSVAVASVGNAWELGQNRRLIDVTLGDKPSKQETNDVQEPDETYKKDLQSVYVGRHRLLPWDQLGLRGSEAQKKAYEERLFTTEINIKDKPMVHVSRYWVEDLQYLVTPSGPNREILEPTQGLRLIPITSTEDKVRIPTVPVNIRQRYPQVVEAFFNLRGNRHLNRNAVSFDEWTVRRLLNVVRVYQINGLLPTDQVPNPTFTEAQEQNPREAEVISEEQIDSMIANSPDPGVGSDLVERYASDVAYGPKRLNANRQNEGGYDLGVEIIDGQSRNVRKYNKNLPIHILTPHTSASEWYFDDLKNLINPSAKPQTSIHHVSAFYRFEGTSRDSRRSMLSEGQPTNLRMAFVRKGKKNTASSREVIEATQLNLALWFALYYESPDGYAFSDDYEFDPSQITNLEELFEMARGWLKRDYVRKDFNAKNSARIAARFKKLMEPVGKIADAKAGGRPLSKDDVELANDNVWELRSLIAMLFGEKPAQEIETAHEKLWDVLEKFQEDHLDQVTAEEKLAVGALITQLQFYEENSTAAAEKIPYYKLLQSDPALAEYCNEGIKDQLDKGLNVPLSRKLLYKIYPKADADAMMKTAENKLCQIQIQRSGKRPPTEEVPEGATPEERREIFARNQKIDEAFDKLLDEKPCTVQLPGLTYKILSRDWEPRIEKMTPLYTLEGTVANIDDYSAANPIMSEKYNEDTNEYDRTNEIRLIGNGLSYAPHTTLDIVNNLATTYLPFHKAGAWASTTVAMAFLKEHLRRTGIDTKYYITYTSKILNEIYKAEAKMVFSTSEIEEPAKRDKIRAEYVQGVEIFFTQKLPEIINAAANSRDDDEEEEEFDGHMPQAHNPHAVPEEDVGHNPGLELATKLYEGLDGTNGVKQLVAAAAPVPNAAALALQKQFTFTLFKEAKTEIDKIVTQANRIPINSTMGPDGKPIANGPRDEVEAYSIGKKRVKFYYQPGINALSNLGLVRNNPNVMFVELGTAIKQSQTKREQPVGQFYDHDIDGFGLHKRLTAFVESSPDTDPKLAEALTKYKASLAPNSIVGRSWKADPIN